MEPGAENTQAVPLNTLVETLAGRRIAVLTGAGCSTESGIPDYRGPSGSHRKRRPIRYQEFVKDAHARTRYWARSAVGWPRFANAQPNDGHRALARLEALGVLSGLITQNVDGLHAAAGSTRVVELHGSLHRVRCLACGWWIDRHELQRRLLEANPRCASWGAELAPDGDAELGPELIEGFRVPECGACAGMLKPDVVFFGENVPGPIVDEAWRVLEEAGALLVVGSSLEVFSGFRFVRRAAEQGKPVAIVNLGPTRGDPLATVRVELPAGKALGALADALAARPA